MFIIRDAPGPLSRIAPKLDTVWNMDAAELAALSPDDRRSIRGAAARMREFVAQVEQLVSPLKTAA